MELTVNRKTTSLFVMLYALLLLAGGCSAFVISPLHAVPALAGGIGAALVLGGLAVLYRRAVVWSGPALQTTIGVFSLSFAWRALEVWRQVWDGRQEREQIAVLLSVLFILSILMLWPLFRGRR